MDTIISPILETTKLRQAPQWVTEMIPWKAMCMYVCASIHPHVESTSRILTSEPRFYAFWGNREKENLTDYKVLEYFCWYYEVCHILGARDRSFLPEFSRNHRRNNPHSLKLTILSEGQISPPTLTSFDIIRGKFWQPASVNFDPHWERLILWHSFWFSSWEHSASCILELNPPLGLARKDQTNALHSIKPSWQQDEAFKTKFKRTACS